MGSASVLEVMVQERNAETYEKYAEELLRFATVLVGADFAPDVLSDAVLRAFSAKGWSDVQNRRAYLFRCVANEARSQHRALRRRQAVEARAASLEAVSRDPVDIDVVRALRSLSPRQRAVVYFVYWEDQDDQTIADLLGISSGTVHRHLARARSNLRRMLHV
jgi:RNA polymerase sigma factor (sigma-70 family)